MKWLVLCDYDYFFNHFCWLNESWGHLLVVKKKNSHFLYHVGHYTCIQQVVKYTFWHYEHFWPINNAILLKLMLW